MKKFQLREPELDVMPVFVHTDDPIVGIDMYLDKVDDYFDRLSDTLDNISHDLSKFKVNSPALPKSTADMWNNAYRQGMISANQLTKFLEEIF